MKSLINALHAIATSLNRIALAIESKNTPTLSKTITSNPYTSSKTSISVVPSKSTYVDNSKNSSELQSIIDNIYKALTDKGSYPHHHDHIFRELKTKWPVLFQALQRLESYVDQSKGNWKSYSKYNSQIWKNKNTNKYE